MRYISILNYKRKRCFVDSVKKTIIKCAFALDKDYSPDCAACNIENMEREASCRRLNNEDHLIGILPGKKIAPNSATEGKEKHENPKT